MIVVSDSTPLNCLILTETVHVLPASPSWPRSAVTGPRRGGSGEWSSTPAQVTPRPCRDGKRNSKIEVPLARQRQSNGLCLSEEGFRRYRQPHFKYETALASKPGFPLSSGPVGDCMK